MIEYRAIGKEDQDEVFTSLARLFKDMYVFMNENGLNLQLIEDGENVYVNSIKKTFGRNNFAVSACKDDVMIGFGIASLRVTPPYLGSKRVGAVTHMFVDPNHRGHGIAGKILTDLESWMKEKEVQSIELEVLYENELGLKFWKRNGFEEELFKLRKKV